MNNYFEKIRNDETQLTAFFSGMPKGGDLHNHYSGAVYTESYWDCLADSSYLVDTINLDIADPKSWKKMSKNIQKRYLPIAIIKERKNIEMKQRILQFWSVKDYYDAYAPSDKHFFDAFVKFPNLDRRNGFQELKKRAIAENVQYLEIMVGGPSYKDTATSYDAVLRDACNRTDTFEINRNLEILYNLFCTNAIKKASDYAASIKNDHANIDDDANHFMMRFIAAPQRESKPFNIFRRLIAGFETVLADSLFVGINFVSPEYGDLSMQDYKLHMYMFKFLHEKPKYKNVNISLHAGELALGNVKPEDLTFHIHDAVFIGKAKRIGHGVDIAFEKNYDSTLKYMRDSGIAIEINLFSNEFILKVKDDRHPLMLYKKYKVPIVICTDDAGILRSNLVHQYVLLAKRYKGISYDDIKTIITNSIKYSFYNDSTKQQRIKNLEERINRYEKQVLAETKQAP